MKIRRVVPLYHRPLTMVQRLNIAFYFLGFAFFIGWMMSRVVDLRFPFSYSAFLFAEVGITLSALGGALVFWKYRPRTLPPSREGLSVDVFITTVNEDLAVLRRAVLSCLRLDYPCKIYLLDDGKRPEVERLADMLEVGYLSRPDRKGAKAGNINYALGRTEGEFIAVFDADGVARKDFLSTLLGYFEDPRVAVVQSNQTYYNLDSFQHAPNVEKTGMWNEQSLYYDIILCGRDAVDGAAWTGNGSVIRRSALEAIGGVATGSLTEDLHTSILLMDRNYKIVYHPVPLAYGLAPRDYESFLSQRDRWQVGFFQALKMEWKTYLFSPRINFAQKISLLEPIIYYGEALPRVVAFLLPGILLTSKGHFISGPLWIVGVYFLMWLWRSFAYFWVSRGRGINSVLEGFWYLKMWNYTVNFLKFPFLKGDRPFIVTPKDPNPQRSGLKWAYLGVAYSLICLGVCGYFGFTQGFTVGLVFILLLSLYNARIAMDALFLLKRSPLVKGAYGVHCRFPAAITEEEENRVRSGITRVVSDKEMWILSGQPLEKNISLSVNFPQMSFDGPGQVVGSEKLCSEPSLFQIKVRVPGLSAELREHMFASVFDGLGEPIIDSSIKERYLESEELSFSQDFKRASDTIFSQSRWAWDWWSQLRPAD